MTNEEFLAQQAEMRRWSETPVGKAFVAFENALGIAHVADSTSENDERIAKAWTKANLARDAVVAEIKKLQGFA
jgi:hypothetical protein